jgi:hypothetical protein
MLYRLRLFRSEISGPEPHNSGICGLPPVFHLSQAMPKLLRKRRPLRLQSEEDGKRRLS